MAIGQTTRDEPQGFAELAITCTVRKKNIAGTGTTPGACASFRQPVIPPAPLTGDVGRGCGDASRALLFSVIRLILKTNK
jgi:hypothetical protein